MATSGMPTLDAIASFLTVSTSQISAAVLGLVITSAPIKRLAIHFDIASDMKEPPKPNTAANASKLVIFKPFLSRKLPTPSRLATILKITSTAILVARNNKILFILLTS